MTILGSVAVGACGIVALAATLNVLCRAYGLTAIRCYGAALMRMGRTLQCAGQVIIEAEERYRELRDICALSTGVSGAGSARAKRT